MRSLLVLAVVAVAACAPRLEPRSDASSPALRVATWNVHDLFDEIDRTESPGDLDTVLSPSAVEEKLARLGAVLRRVDADVVVLQEVETLALLERLAAGPLAGAGYAAHLVDGRDPRGIDVGVLARVPVRRYASHLEDRAPDGTRPWSRDLVEVHLERAGREVVLLGAHLVSRLDPADDGRRRLQAAALRGVLDGVRAAGATRLVLALGDLNDEAGSQALAPLLADGGLEDLGARLAPADAWTWGGGGARERIDFALVPRPDGAAITSVAVVGGPDVASASDHRPVVVDLWLGGG